ncbi:hypothetical protein [Colwellia hornerae]|uniref:Uncharacterized protein n=1 Tax=Colwellia hornerae TaxID=89402 RepID=A0A5C6QEC9_9GAMM|nr:hypothetical protein [Colwellia hornerae]TWX59427.1 hypothetical protein ESZ28_00325 [Colwellia hornerae]TWX62797.1 hypothetical protein ESZ26_00320 [Colwellia hornerae]TWX67111.1 hypothetical protein ESZ27_09560 [Colwellia hornerae]
MVQKGQHLDMVEAYRPETREMDDLCLLHSHICVDNIFSALYDTGDLALRLQAKVIVAEHLKADLLSLCDKYYVFERKIADITIMKLVGYVLENISAAKLVAQYVIASK